MSFTGHVVNHHIWPRTVIFSNIAITIITVLITLLEFDKINGLSGDEHRNVIKLVIITSHITLVFRCRSLPLRQCTITLAMEP